MKISYTARELFAMIAVVGADTAATLAVMNVLLPRDTTRGKPFWDDREHDRLMRGWTCFDLTPVNAPVVGGFRLRMQLTTCPVDQMAELVAEAHGVMFVRSPGDDAVLRAIDAGKPIVFITDEAQSKAMFMYLMKAVLDRDREQIEALRRLKPTRPTVRSLAEMHFAASLAPCAKCGAAARRLDLYGNGGHYSLTGKCPTCGKTLQYDFDCDGDPLNMPNAPLELGGPEPSRVIAPKRFLDELARLDARILPPGTLGANDWSSHYDDARRAAIVVLELCKFPPDASRAWLEAQSERVLDRLEAFDAESPRIWRLAGALSLVDEIRALANQVGRNTPLDAASLRRYIERRGEPRADGDVGVIVVRSERPVAELEVRRGTTDDLEKTYSRIRDGKLRFKAGGRTHEAHLELDGKNVTRVTIDFSSSPKPA